MAVKCEGKIYRYDIEIGDYREITVGDVAFWEACVAEFERCLPVLRDAQKCVAVFEDVLKACQNHMTKGDSDEKAT